MLVEIGIIPIIPVPECHDGPNVKLEPPINELSLLLDTLHCNGLPLQLHFGSYHPTWM